MPPTRAPERPRQQQVALPPIPFTAAAHEHTEPVTTDTTLALGAAQQPRGPFDVPAYGFLRNIYLEVTGSGGTLGAGVLHPDYPFNVLQNVSLIDVNGAPIFGPLDGFALLQANIWGGYAYRSDPASPRTTSAPSTPSSASASPWRSAATTATGRWRTRTRQRRTSWRGLSPSTTQAYTTAPTTPASFQVRAWLEAWSQPNATDLTGRPQMREPIGHGTTQFWSQFTKSGLAAGNQTILLPRVGNLIRSLIFICRDNTANTVQRWRLPGSASGGVGRPAAPHGVAGVPHPEADGKHRPRRRP
jgi:hypothetical protein